MACLYRHYDSAGALLYVGISTSKFARLEQHQRSSSWFNQVARVEFQECRDIDHARRAEYWAIQTECPKYNIQHASGLPSNAEVGAAIKFTLAEAYGMAKRGEVLATIDPIEFARMDRSERRTHRRAWKRLAQQYFAASGKSP